MKPKSKQKMKSASFLLGAGFSAPAGLPLSFEIGNRFQKLESTDYVQHFFKLDEYGENLAELEKEFVALYK
jgi:hypothetical protein